jgi:hypothetical protein
MASSLLGILDEMPANGRELQDLVLCRTDTVATLGNPAPYCCMSSTTRSQLLEAGCLIL